MAPPTMTIESHTLPTGDEVKCHLVNDSTYQAQFSGHVHLLRKAKGQYLLTWNVSRYRLLALHNSGLNTSLYVYSVQKLRRSLI